MRNSKEKRVIAQSEALDKTAKIVSGLVPGGASAYELFTALVAPLHVKRKEGWVREVTMRLHKLETEGKIKMEELSRNEEFNTIITKATLLAQQTHQKEKVEALRNIVQNAAIKLPSSVMYFDMMDYFLSILDRINPIQILLLKLYKDPQTAALEKNIDLTPFKDSNSSLDGSEIKNLFYLIHPELKEKDELVIYSWKELIRVGFVKSDPINKRVPNSSILKVRTRKLGEQFLEMIEGRE